MPVLHDYKCPVHGYCENTEPACAVEGCDEAVALVFLQAVAVVSERTKRTDKTAKNLAADFKMTDIKTTREGESQQGYYTRNNANPAAPVVQQAVKQRELQAGKNAVWGGGQQGINMANVLAGRVAKPVRDEAVSINPKDVGNLTGPKPASYFKDQDNLQIPK